MVKNYLKITLGVLCLSISCDRYYHTGCGYDDCGSNSGG